MKPLVLSAAAALLLPCAALAQAVRVPAAASARAFRGLAGMARLPAERGAVSAEFSAFRGALDSLHGEFGRLTPAQRMLPDASLALSAEQAGLRAAARESVGRVLEAARLPGADLAKAAWRLSLASRLADAAGLGPEAALVEAARRSVLARGEAEGMVRAVLAEDARASWLLVRQDAVLRPGSAEVAVSVERLARALPRSRAPSGRMERRSWQRYALETVRHAEDILLRDRESGGELLTSAQRAGLVDVLENAGLSPGLWRSTRLEALESLGAFGGRRRLAAAEHELRLEAAGRFGDVAEALLQEAVRSAVRGAVAAVF